MKPPGPGLGGFHFFLGSVRRLLPPPGHTTCLLITSLEFDYFALPFKMRKHFSVVGAVVLACLILTESCTSHDIPEYECHQTYRFSEHVRPIIESKCAISGCHNGDMGPDLNWNDFAQFHERAESGLVRFRVTRRIMPPPDSPAGPLTQEEINAIACWSDQGALNN